MHKYYTIEFKLKALVALDRNNRNIVETAKQLGISRQTLNDWSRDRDKLYERSEQLAEANRLPLHRRLNILINQISDALPGMVENARLGDATRALTTLLALSESLEAKETRETDAYETLNEKFGKLIEQSRRELLADPEAYIRNHHLRDEDEADQD